MQSDQTLCIIQKRLKIQPTCSNHRKTSERQARPAWEIACGPMIMTLICTMTSPRQRMMFASLAAVSATSNPNSQLYQGQPVASTVSKHAISCKDRQVRMIISLARRATPLIKPSHPTSTLCQAPTPPVDRLKMRLRLKSRSDSTARRMIHPSSCATRCSTVVLSLIHI